MNSRTVLALVLLVACDAEGVPAADVAAAPAVENATPGAEQDDARRAGLRAIEPVATRGGQPRFTDLRLRDPLAAEVFGERLGDESQAGDLRLALAEALPRCGGPWADVSVARLAIEADAGVRAVLIAGLRRAEGEQALVGARAGLADAEAKVRRAAAELAGWVPEVGVTLAEELRAALRDPSAEVRGAATRAIGLTGNKASFEAVVGRLADREAQVRLEAVRALRRIDAKRAVALPAMATLRQDPDERVQAAARG